ncbi:MAG: ABC transporter permease [Allomuricauda sp.]
MKRLLVFIKKEFTHVLRDKKTLLILFGMPIMQILIFGFVLSNEVKNTNLVIIDNAQDQATKQIIAKIEASEYFEIREESFDAKDMEASFKQGKSKAALIFPLDFEKELNKNHTATIQIIADASDPNYATTIENYLTAIVQDYISSTNGRNPYTIVPEVRMLYNPQLKGAPNFVPGVMALILMLVCVLMTAVSIVREKETGTMEVLLVSPFKPMMVIVSKVIPYFILSLLNIVSILLLSVYVLDVPIKGNVFLLFAESALFITTCLSLGIFISIRTQSQQVAMLISLMGMLLPTILFSGFMFPIENMPKILQIVSNIIPAKWYYIIVKDIMIKGLGFSAVCKETFILVGITVFLLFISVKNFKIRLA